MTHFQKWEGDIQQLCDVFECFDNILSGRLEHNLTAEDIPNDTQVGSSEVVLLTVILSFSHLLTSYYCYYVM